MSSETKTCQNCRQKFWIEPEDFAFYERIKVPPPTWCSRCRTQRRLAFRNEKFLYKQKSDYSDKEIFSMYPKDVERKVYENEIWFSDKWDPLVYGEEIDFSRPFIEQIFDLIKKVPIYARSAIYGVNSDYSNNFTDYKNCYLVFNGNYSEDCMYGTGISHAKNCIDNSYLDHCENCYECFWLTSCSNSFFSTQCANSFNLFFCKNCIGCNDCFGCADLRNKKYHIFNKPFTKETYQAELKRLGFNFGSFISKDVFLKRTNELWLRFPVKYMEGVKNTNVTGDYIWHSKNAIDCYVMIGGENVKHCQYMELGPIKDSMDYSVWGNGAELIYESTSCGLGAHNIKFCFECWSEVRDMEYSLFCLSSSNLFGCVGLRNKQYCILNKQYSQESFDRLRTRIIEHMSTTPYVDKLGRVYKYGEFFPSEFSPFPYNHTQAQEHFPLTKNESRALHYYWEEVKEREYVPTVSPSDLPDNISEVNESILKEIILCEHWEKGNHQKELEHNCTKAFRVLPQELKFYQRFNIPPPRLCPNCRHFERTKQKNSLELHHRRCQCMGQTSENKLYKNETTHFHGTDRCPNEFEASYAPDRPEIVYCEHCYNAEVV